MLEQIKQYLRFTSWPIITAMIALMVIGVLAIRVSERGDQTMYGFTVKQVRYAAVGLAVFVAATVVPYHRFGRWAYPLMGLTIGLLVLVLFLPPIRHSHRWIDLRFLKVQPSEVAKLAFILVLAWYLRSGDNYRRLVGLLVPFAIALVPMGLILREPDLGTSLLFLPTLLIMLFMAGAKIRHLAGVVAIAAVVVLLPVPRRIPSDTTRAELADRRAMAYWHTERYVVSPLPLAIMKSHQVDRIDGWLRQGNPAVRMGKGYQLHQSKMIFGAGGLTGRGDWYDADTFFRMLPDDHTDFIFSVVGGQWGFVGCLAVLFLYAVIFVFGVEIASITHDAFGRLLAVGVLALLFTQLVINIGMTMGLMPITGMTLPLVSYGGSSLVVNCAALGLLVNVGQRRPILLGKRPFEYGDRAPKPPAPFGPLGHSGARPVTR
ncbi:MAG TPA: FtsW/RodA/SpoVE family cell cycle protein [Phycisphaerae bacterium]|nr:FtsW/RodA/SpoVE family cell cycle protein [Phycisphaerae bacterium]HUT61787.1 FtsW/RodA/SpoVE family cell cycle protein [Phycisphaerae bacterium]